MLKQKRAVNMENRFPFELTSSSKGNASREVHHGRVQNEIVIKFVGDSKENIQHILDSLSCSVVCKKQLAHILNLYSRKIDKLRSERDTYKDMLIFKQEQSSLKIKELSAIIDQLKQEVRQQNKIISFYDKCTCHDTKEIFSDRDTCECNQQQQSCGTSTNRFRDAYLPKYQQEYQPQQVLQESEITANEPQQPSKEEQLLIQHQSIDPALRERSFNQPSFTPKLQRRSTQKEITENTIQEDELIKLMLKYNFSIPELQHVLEQYQAEHKLAEQLFDSQRHRNLYKLGQKMQKDLWNKKVMQDVKRLSNLKNQSGQSSSLK